MANVVANLAMWLCSLGENLSTFFLKKKKVCLLLLLLLLQKEQLTTPTLSVLVAVGDVPPLVGAHRLGGDVLTHPLGIGVDLHFRAIGFDLRGQEGT